VEFALEETKLWIVIIFVLEEIFMIKILDVVFSGNKIAIQSVLELLN